MDWTGLIEVELEWKQSSKCTVNTAPLVECHDQKNAPQRSQYLCTMPRLRHL
jgi:hypothetical protein